MKLVLPILLLGFSLSGAPLYEWNFDDKAGTPLSKTTNSGAFPGTWNGDFEGSATNGIGQFILRRTPGTTSNVFVPVAPPRGENFPQRTWTLIEFAEWDFGGGTTNETIRLGLADKPHEARPSVLDQIKFGRNDEGKVFAMAESFGSEATNTEEMTVFPESPVGAITLVLETDLNEGTYSLFYRDGEGPFLNLGGGLLSPERGPFFLRLGASGHFRASGEFVSIDRIAVLSEDPLGS